MAVLINDEIVNLAKDENCKLLGYNYAETNIQGCSYDLRVGTIFTHQGRKDYDIISHSRDNRKIVKVFPSEIITMLTLEEIRMPCDLCGTVFPINKHSSTGLLILNPGHIDPGYIGPLSICAINLSNEAITLDLGEDIFTIVFNKLSGKTNGYEQKNACGNRINYEYKYYCDNASKLSPSIFDSLTMNQNVPVLRGLIKSELWDLVKNALAYLAVIATILALIVGLVVGYFTLYPIKEGCENKVPIESQEEDSHKLTTACVLNDTEIGKKDFNEKN